MPLLLMLKFKRHYRTQIYFPGVLPVASWLLTLSKEELQQVSVTMKAEKVVEMEA